MADLGMYCSHLTPFCAFIQGCKQLEKRVRGDLKHLLATEVLDLLQGSNGISHHHGVGIRQHVLQQAMCKRSEKQAVFSGRILHNLSHHAHIIEKVCIDCGLLLSEHTPRLLSTTPPSSAWEMLRRNVLNTFCCGNS